MKTTKLEALKEIVWEYLPFIWLGFVALVILAGLGTEAYKLIENESREQAFLDCLSYHWTDEGAHWYCSDLLYNYYAQ